MLSLTKQLLFALIASTIVSACGGGGGGSSPAPIQESTPQSSTADSSSSDDSSSDSSSSDDSTFDIPNMLKDIADNVIMPNYADLATKAADFSICVSAVSLESCSIILS